MWKKISLVPSPCFLEYLPDPVSLFSLPFSQFLSSLIQPFSQSHVSFYALAIFKIQASFQTLISMQAVISIQALMSFKAQGS